MKAIINIFREIEIPKEYEHLFKKGSRPYWQTLDWDKVDLDWDSYAIFCAEITKTLNSTDEWEFLDY